MKLLELRQLIREEIVRRLTEASTAEQAKELGLHYAGFGRWMDDNGDIVAKTIDGNLVKLDAPEELEDPGIKNKKTLQQIENIFKDGGRVVPEIQNTGSNRIIPAWNKAYDDVPYDANGEETVKKLLAKIGDPGKLIRWLIKKFREETPNGKQRILQYLGILKEMGIGVEEESGNRAEESPAQESPHSERTAKHSGDLFRF